MNSDKKIQLKSEKIIKTLKQGSRLNNEVSKGFLKTP